MIVDLLRRIGTLILCFGAACAVTALFLHNGFDEVPIAAWGWLALIGAVPILIFFRSFRAQVFSRAALWANLIFGTLLSFIAQFSTEVQLAPLILVFTSGAALLVLGTRGLEASRSSCGFAPLAFRGTLVAIIVMALSDTTTLLFWGGVVTELALCPQATFFLGAGLVMALAVYGLARLRTWGFLLNILANVIIAGGCWLMPEMPNPIRICLSSTAVAQVLIGMPLIHALVRGHQPEAPMNNHRVSRVSAAVIVCLMAAVVLINVGRLT